jgi:transposase-like protein
MATPKRFTEEFKIEAVKLTESSKEPISVIAKELGVALSTLHGWREQA